MEIERSRNVMRKVAAVPHVNTNKSFFRFRAGDIARLSELLNTCVKKSCNRAEKVSDLGSPPLQSLESESLQLHQSDIARLRSTHSYQLLKSRY